MTALTAALAKMLEGIAPGVQQTYSDAAGAQAAFAKGFSDTAQAAQTQRAGNVSDFLQDIVGAPASQVAQVQGQVNPAGTGDTLYGLRGYIPASTLTEEGAAYTANARQLPFIANTQGLQQIGRLQANQSAQDRTFANELAQVGAQAPKLTMDLQNQAFSQAATRTRLAQSQERLDLQSSMDAFNQKYKINTYNLSVDKFNQAANRFAQQTLNENRAYVIQLANLGLRKRADQRAVIAQEYKLANGGFTAKQILDFKTKALNGADNAYNGGTDAKGQPIYKATYQEALAAAGEHGVPISIMRAALNTFYKPGERGRPRTNNGTASFDFSATNQLTGGEWGGPLGKVMVAPNANRAGVPLNPLVQSFVGRIANVYGQPLTIGTGSNHNEFVVGTDRESDHWTGNAADIPASGAALTRLGQAALIAAGADPKWARKQTGGLFNLNTPNGRVQIIFNSMEGGNHFNHLHVGVR